MPGKKRVALRTGQASAYRTELTNAELAAREAAEGRVPDAAEPAKRLNTPTPLLRQEVAQRRATVWNARHQSRVSRARAATQRAEEPTARRVSRTTNSSDADLAYAALFARARTGQITDARRVRCPACDQWIPAAEALRHSCA